MDEAARRTLAEAGKKYLERLDKFDDRAIGKAWVTIANAEPRLRITTKTGLTLTVHRKIAGMHNVAYEAYRATLLGKRKGKVAWMHCSMPMGGRVQVTNANVYELGGVDYRRQGIGTAIYDLIERDVRAAGAEGLEPHFGSMNDEAIEFWKKRRPHYADKIADLNKLGADVGSWLFD